MPLRKSSKEITIQVQYMKKCSFETVRTKYFFKGQQHPKIFVIVTFECHSCNQLLNESKIGRNCRNSDSSPETDVQVNT